ncbi:uncharacterized protein LOC128989614 [Macrosteles quadrilineatus]|uniref:uncharacterized protein LOC128989614 n=1 Tax=Macrosteles quadrilineatus TaxID=74068 RepID=UPI0023E28F42|nr:uncharacterized protein LOC128989614 [Macrosteles quadrilineatus]XP_054267527.1 uncharacterized protein LOC128989614 [Macrosteles quadrilineatus]
MGLIENELEEVHKLCEHLISGSRLISCVQSMVRVEIKKTQFKQVVICIQFPKDYPQSPLLIELKSKTLSDHLLAKLTSICEEEAKKYLGKPQILKVLKFLKSFIEDNLLSCCYDEVVTLKNKLVSETDELKVRQKTSSLSLKVSQDGYFLKTKISVPDDYPLASVRVEYVDTNFPPLFHRFFVAQANELSRQCVEPPIRRKTTDPPFSPKPSLLPVASFFVESVKKFPQEKCQLCKEKCLPTDPQKVEPDESADMHVERVYCGHLFHLLCLITHMKTPPFKDGKKCPQCAKQIFHDKWKVSERLAEARWAHQQARDRELQEVSEFFE